MDLAYLEKVLEVKKECYITDKDFITCCEGNVFGDQADGRLILDLMVPLVIVRSAVIDAAREKSRALHHPSVLDFSESNLKMEDIFLSDKRVVLMRGLPGSGKSVLCRFILHQWHMKRLWVDRFDLIFYVNATVLMNLLERNFDNEEAVLKALYPRVFRSISFYELQRFKCLIIIDSIDECYGKPMSARAESSSVESAIKRLIISREMYKLIILGGPYACDEVKDLLKYVPFEFVEVFGFSEELVKLYVDKLFATDTVQAEKIWRKLREDKSLFATVHRPVFANIVCSLLTSKSGLSLETMTEICVYLYALFLPRHWKGSSAKKVNSSTFQDLFVDEMHIAAVVKVGKVAFQSLTSGKVFVPVIDFNFTDIELTLLSPFIVCQRRYVCFVDVMLMEFFAAVHLFISGLTLDDNLIQSKDLRRVLPMLFGLHGGAVEGSKSPEIICSFVKPLTQRFNISPLKKLPFTGHMGECVYSVDRAFYLNMLFEFTNPSMVRDPDLYWCNNSMLYVRKHSEFAPLFFFLANFIILEQRRIRCLVIHPSDREISLNETRQLHECISNIRGKVDVLQFSSFSVNKEMMEWFASCCCLVPEVWLSDIQAASDDPLWKIFADQIRDADQKNCLQLKSLVMSACKIDEENKCQIEQILGKFCIR